MHTLHIQMKKEKPFRTYNVQRTTNNPIHKTHKYMYTIRRTNTITKKNQLIVCFSSPINKEGQAEPIQSSLASFIVYISMTSYNKIQRIHVSQIFTYIGRIEFYSQLIALKLSMYHVNPFFFSSLCSAMLFASLSTYSIIIIFFFSFFLCLFSSWQLCMPCMPKSNVEKYIFGNEKS